MQIERLYQDVLAGKETHPATLTREYGREEFLLVVGAGGEPVGSEAGLLEQFLAANYAHSQSLDWFQVGALRSEEFLPYSGETGNSLTSTDERPGEPVLLAARWLCHLVGLRHRTVEIFLDLPGVEEGHTLVQVRGMDKIEAPGAFDIPCAGHVSESETAFEALGKELGEELNLTIADLNGLRLVSRYLSPARISKKTILLNEEYRYLYRAYIQPASVPRIRFSDGEVAGLALMNFNELCRLAQRYPERIASGLGDAFQYYG